MSILKTLSKLTGTDPVADFEKQEAQIRQEQPKNRDGKPYSEVAAFEALDREIRQPWDKRVEGGDLKRPSGPRRPGV